MYVNRDFYNSLSDLEKKAFEVAANASLSKSMSYRIIKNGIALKELTDNHRVILEDTPADYFREYMAAAKKHFNLQLTKMSSLQKSGSHKKTLLIYQYLSGLGHKHLMQASEKLTYTR